MQTCTYNALWPSLLLVLSRSTMSPVLSPVSTTPSPKNTPPMTRTSKALLESTGGINAEGLGLLRQLFRFAAKREGVHLSVYCGRAWARLACNLQFSVSQAILNRVAGVGVGVEVDLI